MGETQVRLDERLECNRVQRRPEPVQGPAHQAKVNPADDLAALPREAAERTVAQPDRIARVHGAVRSEAEITEKPHQTSDRFSFVEQSPRIRDHGVTPPHTGIDRSCACVGNLCELIHEGPGQEPIRVGIRLVRVRPEGIAEAGSPASGRLTSLAINQTGIDHLVEVLANCVRVEAQRVGKLADLQWPLRPAQEGQQARPGNATEDSVSLHGRCHACILHGNTRK
ncbi:MAG: hypothetical protein ABIR11_00700 [Candidatus Limnocylindrales bacterium]